MFFSYTPDINPKFGTIFRIQNNSITFVFSAHFSVHLYLKQLVLPKFQILCSYLLTSLLFAITLCFNSSITRFIPFFFTLCLALSFPSCFSLSFSFQSVHIPSQVGNITSNSLFSAMALSLSSFAFLHSNFLHNPKGCCHTKFFCLSYIICFSMSYHCISQFPLIFFLERQILFCFISYHQSFQLINNETFFICSSSLYKYMYLCLIRLSLDHLHCVSFPLSHGCH